MQSLHELQRNSVHRIIQLMDVALNISVNITVYEGKCSYGKAVELANEKLVGVLKNERIEVYFDGAHHRIENEVKDKYKFEVCIKKLPEPIDVSMLTNEEKEGLLLDERYMTTSDDYKEVSWSISDVYKKLRSAYPNKDEFYLSSLAYRIERLEINPDS